MAKKRNLEIGIIGAGVMGTALSVNLLKQGIVKRSQLTLSDKNKEALEQRKKQLGVNISQNNADLVAKADYIILAIKPQDFMALAEELSAPAAGKKIFLSIMAGVPLAQLKKRLATQRVVRAMPNLAAKVGQAFVVWKSGCPLSRGEKLFIDSVFNSLGKSVVVANEDDINKATAVSGSGPAYFYYFLELLIESARGLGFSEVLARTMVEQTIRGAWAVYEQTGAQPSELRAQVSSKGGTTAAALESFQKNKLDAVIKRGVKAAYIRAKELSR
ncbi:MAG: pyrroline-5-carboxylate reductase [Candidatus Komeilibacteria bacterium]|nr:pyrroline-5-carboxylate reductase [Candidatus Komeilibacteria bacterium]